jgi:secretory carrier-associated membrane protein
LFCISGDIAVGVLALIIGVGFGVAALGDFMLIVRVRDEIFIFHLKPSPYFVISCTMQVSRLYRSTGASLSKAQAEFTSGVLGNEHVRGVATDVVSQTIRNQMSNSTAPRF